jgi:hypothetical protein
VFRVGKGREGLSCGMGAVWISVSLVEKRNERYSRSKVTVDEFAREKKK